MMAVVLKILVALWWRPRKIEEHFAKQGIRGPPYNFLLGNAKEILSLMSKSSSQPMPTFSHNILPRVLSFYHHWKKIYGGMFLIWFGPTVRLTISDPDLIREIFISKSELFEKIEAHPVFKQLEGDGLLNLNGEKWSHHRKITTPAFNIENIKLLVPMVVKCVNQMLDRWIAMSNSDEIEIEVSECYQTLTKDVIARTTFGCSYDEGEVIFRLQAQQMVYVADALKNVTFPISRFLPTKKNMRAWKLDKEINRSLENVIKKRMHNWREDELDQKDLLGLMVQATLGSKEGLEPKITVHDIAEECKNFFFAGEQTTTNLLTWTTILLAMHPQWQLMARDEVFKVCGSSDVPSKDDISKFKILNMVINESLRLYPSVVATIRRSRSNVELGGYKIPSGTELLIPILAIHHDQAIWGHDANEFNPARFSGGVARATKHPLGFIPFGLGIRTCIGQNLVMLQTKLTLAIILQRFSFTISPKYKHAPTVLMILHPQHGAPIIFRRL
ncbi:cytochrome P450 734A1-like [Impatiens glandulifera]|uniref:cytochrome P450 734A1-like n=1 Tax=Impatiens glandulifera TaxID=253017 RepID=UPI001FB14D21|nr:cytochrome P450 734A1-like [Impatiens glandulifera]